MAKRQAGAIPSPVNGAAGVDLPPNGTAAPFRFLKPRNVAELLGCSTVTVWRLRKREDFPAFYRVSGGVAARSDELFAWMKRRQRVDAPSEDAAA